MFIEDVEVSGIRQRRFARVDDAMKG